MDFKIYLDMVKDFAPNLVMAIIILLGFIFAGRILKKIISKKITSDNPVIMNLIGQTVKTLFFLFGLVTSSTLFAFIYTFSILIKVGFFITNLFFDKFFIKLL